ncbi:glycine betaine ABC transporter substrate-binding protein [Tindallia californiensis]|uniref:Osmoprotectant transport system substrate-binding protein/osmoprotectant transport system permease protein n=1 Tax=Tindallia californiensis TaxID=159292 RepID=A0A1H3QE47_9FIRM|nr:glycine betaine ABC transporter substrate-binding protein [Tindallia californiensis]SDZ11637.1 osmoprotectant transport system substrate-binding protein/osmoprotectant transport system permease protein [Tindallia californiensis]
MNRIKKKNNRRNLESIHSSSKGKASYQIIIMVLMVTLAAGLLTACGGSSDKEEEEPKKVVLASKPMTEQYILAEILTLLIEAETDIEVEQTLGIGGGTSNIHPAMENGEIDLYPEYTGTGWLFVLKEEVLRDPDELYEAVKTSYREEYGIHWSGRYGLNNTYSIAVTPEAAEAYDLQTLSDLGEVSSELTFAANADFLEREDGYPGLEETYGFAFGDIKEIDIGLRYQSIQSDDIDAITVFSTDGQLQDANVVLLEDDKNFFVFYDGATLIRQETLDGYPELEEVLEKLTGLIPNEEMIAMNYAVEIKNEDPAKVAEDFLREKGLL